MKTKTTSQCKTAIAMLIASLLLISGDVQSALGQTCGVGLGSLLSVKSLVDNNPKSSSTPVRIGDVLQLNQIAVANVASALAASYECTNLSVTVTFPNNSLHNVLTIQDLRAGGSGCAKAGSLFGSSGWTCPLNAAIDAPPLNPVCQPGINDTYTVAAANISASPVTDPCNPGVTIPAKTIRFVMTGQGQMLDQSGNPTGSPGICNTIYIPVIQPAITIVKECINTCTDGNTAPYGQSISYRVTICNTGDTLLTNIRVTNTLAGTTPVQIAVVASLPTNSCVVLTNTETPVSNLCGPFTNTITATATPSGLDPRPVGATNTAVCTVCTTPCRLLPASTRVRWEPPTPPCAPSAPRRAFA